MTRDDTPLVRVDDLSKVFDGGGTFFKRRTVRAVDGVTFEIAAGDTLGLVGESGSGKSTLGRIVVGLEPASSGHCEVAEINVGTLRGRARKRLWRHAQMVFQDPYSSLNPRMTVRDSLMEPLRNFGVATGPDAEKMVVETLNACGLSATALHRYPREFSGGQRQRVGIARALITRPDFIVADEPVSALDVSVQAQIINLLQDLRQEFGLTFLFIAHDLGVVRHVADRVAVMYHGKIVEIGSADQVYEKPRHPYTRLLLSSVPFPDVALERERLRTTRRSSAVDRPHNQAGCKFSTRCPLAQPLCSEAEPRLGADAEGHAVACHFEGAAPVVRPGWAFF